MTAPIVIRYASKLPSVSNLREHWATRARRVKAQRSAVHIRWLQQVRGEQLPPFPLVVTMTRVSPRTLDVGDNLNTAFKAQRDQVAAELGVDDADPRVEWRYDQRKGVPREQAIEIRIEARAKEAA